MDTSKNQNSYQSPKTETYVVLPSSILCSSVKLMSTEQFKEDTYEWNW